MVGGGDIVSNTHIRLGKAGEFAACAYLEMQEMVILERNWRCRLGEVDIIALDEDCLVFCEVKTRKKLDTGAPEEQVTTDRQKRYARCAQIYSERCEAPFTRIRFDVIAIHAYDDQSGELRHFVNAFEASDL